LTAACVHIVHCIDTEGPLYESLDAKFERLKDLFGISHLAPTQENLQLLKEGRIDLKGREADVQKILSGHLTAYNETWHDIDAMLERVGPESFRRKIPDSFGGGWKFNWFCMDHINYEYNPRHRDIGYHNIYDYYHDFLKGGQGEGDGLYWHFHPMSSYRDAHRCATHYFRTTDIFQILARKVIERHWFPSAYRAGFQTERPDSHWFLEQWIPFDISNMALDDPSVYDASIDFRNGRSGDWRLAPADWSVYHPDHDNYQLPGKCRRVIGRALNVLNRIASIDQREMDKAFARAAKGLPTLVGIASHDWRDLGTEVDHVRELIVQSASRFPDVPFKYCDANQAFQDVLWPQGCDGPALSFDLNFIPPANGDVPSVEIVLTSGKVFGPQPFLALETRGRQFFHDNLDFSTTGDRWYYAFHDETVPFDDIARIGVAANDRYGNTCVRQMDFRTGTISPVLRP
jgi:hypothetical protein